MAAVLMSLSTKLQCAGSRQPASANGEDVGVNEILIDLGGTVLAKGIPMHNTLISNVCIFSDDVKGLSDPVARRCADALWQKRFDYWGIPTTQRARALGGVRPRRRGSPMTIRTHSRKLPPKTSSPAKLLTASRSQTR